MLMAATKGEYTLFIDYDSDPLNPRTDCDPFGKMICFHRRYNLGDKHEYKESADFLRALVRISCKPHEIISYVKDGCSDNLIFEYNKLDDVWILQSYSDFSKSWCEEYVVEAPLDLDDEDMSDAIIDDMWHEDLERLASKMNVLLPLYLYDHSIQSISTGSFIGRAQHAEWDSCQVGWTYATPEMIREEYGEVNAETIEKARNLLVNEVDTYDHYLRGESYGFMLYEGETETDSCWGYLGDLDAMTEDIRAELPTECRELVDMLEYCADNSIADYFWRRAG